MAYVDTAFEMSRAIGDISKNRAIRPAVIPDYPTFARDRTPFRMRQGKLFYFWLKVLHCL